MRAVGRVFRVPVLSVLATCLAAVLVSAGAAVAAVTSWPQATTDLKANPDVTFGTLPNGLRYAIRHNAAPPGEVSVRLVIEAGSMQETAGQEGIAHLIEHMAFRGTTRVADGEIMKTLQRLGSQVGADANAATSPLETVYQFNLTKPDAQSVDTVLGFLREIASELTISPSALDSERKVVLAEARQRAGPALDISLAQQAARFPGHPATRATIGRTEVIESATSAQLRTFYDAYYRPDRAVLVVVGDVDPAAVEAKVKSLFSDWRGRGPAGADPGPYAPTGRRRTIATAAEAGAPPASLSMTWTPAYTAPDWTRAGRIEATIWAIGEAALSTRIFEMKRSTGDPFLRGGAGGYWIPGVARGESLYANGVTDLPATIRILTDARRQIMTQGLTQPEIDFVIAQTRESLKLAAAGHPNPPFLNWSQVIASKLADEAARGEIDLSDQQQLDIFDAAANGLTADRVNAALRTRFAGEGPVIFLASGTPALADETGVETMLASAEAAPLAAYEPPKIPPWTHVSFGKPGQLAERRQIDDLGVTMARFENGVRLTVKPIRTSPGQVEVLARFGHGRLDQPRDRIDSSDWSMNLVQLGGLSDLKVEDTSRTLVGHQVRAFAGVNDDAFTIGSSTAPTEDLDLELQYLTAKLTSPGWRSDGWKSLIEMSDQMYKAAGASPGGVFGQNSAALLHPGDQRWVVDTPQMRAGFTPAAARAFIEPILGDADIEVLVVGDVTADQAIAAVAKTFGALPARKGTTEPAGTRVEHFPAPKVEPVVLHHAGKADQAVAEVSWPTTDEHAAWGDIAPTVILADILRQRATDRLRTAEGATYTPNGGAEFSRVFPGWGRISLLVPCKPGDVAKVYAEIDAIAADLVSKPVTDDELQRALRPDIETARQQQQQIGYWIAQLGGAQTNPDRLEYIRQTLPRLSAVTAADVQRVAKRWLKADRAFRIEVTPAPGAAAASVASQ